MATRNKIVTCLGLFLTLSSFCAAQAPVPSFTITSSNITMPANGIGSIPFTLTSVNGFAGDVIVNMTPPAVGVNVKLPYPLPGGPVHTFILTANGTASGTMTLLALKPAAVPARLNPPKLPGHGQQVVGSLAAAFLLSLCLRRRKAWASRLALAFCTLIALASVSGCGGGPTLTPGTYTYTLTANGIAEETTPVLTATTTLMVTVPSGIATN